MKKLTKAGQEIVDTSIFLFFQKGFKEVTIEEICKFANVTKKVFKQYFKDKDTLVIHILKEINKDSKARFMKVIKADIPVKEKIYQLVLLKEEIYQESSVKFYEDINSDKKSKAFKLAEKAELDWKEILHKFYSDHQKSGDVRSDINIDFMVFMTDQLRDMFKSTRMQKIYPNFSDMTREVMSVFYYGFLKQ